MPRKSKTDRRRCGLCHCELYSDEPGSQCQDCRGVMKALHDNRRAVPRRADGIAAREAKLARRGRGPSAAGAE